MQQGKTTFSHHVFQGREKTLNKAILETLAFHPNLIKNEIFKKIKENKDVLQRIKNKEKFKVVPSTVSRRVDALTGWIEESGERPINLFIGAKTKEYALSMKGAFLIFQESEKVQDNFLMVLKKNLKSRKELTELMRDMLQLLEFLKEVLPKTLTKDWTLILKEKFSKLNLDNLSNEEITTQLMWGTFESFTGSLAKIQDTQKKWKKELITEEYKKL